MQCLRDSQLGDDRVHDIKNYIDKGKLWEAFASEKRVVLLIDEIDAALDQEGRAAFWEALDASEVENIYAITHSTEAHFTFDPS